MIKSNTLLLILPLLFILFGCKQNIDNKTILSENIDSLNIDSLKTKHYFGLDTTGYILKEGRIKKNQFISEILDDFGVSSTDIEEIKKNSSDILNLRNIQAGKQYTLLLRGDTVFKADYLIYIESSARAYIFDFKDSLNITTNDRTTRIELKYSTGTIKSSLWNSMIEAKLNPVLAVELSEIYAWSIDFFGLQKGDKFKIIYEEVFIDTNSTGIKSIHSAWFQHSGAEYYAIPLIQNGKESFYDLKGNSLRKAFLKAPLEFSRISSRFSNSRMHPVLRIRRPHHGVDYAAPRGTPVRTVGNGKIIKKSYDKYNGRIVKIKHNSIYSTAYLHLSRFGKGIKVGSTVKQGQVIGYVGSTGLSTGPHLDFRFYKNGKAIDPLKVKAPTVEPVSEENKQKFEKILQTYKTLLYSFN